MFTFVSFCIQNMNTNDVDNDDDDDDNNVVNHDDSSSGFFPKYKNKSKVFCSLQ